MRVNLIAITALIFLFACPVDTDAQPCQKLKIYQGGKLLAEVECDSIAVEEVDTPLSSLLPDDAYYTINGTIYHGDKELHPTTPDGDIPYDRFGISLSGKDIYFSSIYWHLEDDSFYYNLAIWKNEEFLCEKVFENEIFYGFDVDGDDLYFLYYVDNWGIQQWYCQKNDEAPSRLYVPDGHGLRGWDINEGVTTIVYIADVPSQTHSTSTWYGTCRIARVERDGVFTDLHPRDGSKQNEIENVHFHDGHVYVSGETWIVTNDETRNYAGFIVSSNGLSSYPSEIRAIYDFKFSRDGYCHAIARESELDEGKRCMLGDGSKLYDLPFIGTPDDMYPTSGVSADPYISIVGDDVYVYGSYSYYTDDNGELGDIKSKGFLIKNGELIWGYVDDTIIGNIIKRP